MTNILTRREFLGEAGGLVGTLLTSASPSLAATAAKPSQAPPKASLPAKSDSVEAPRLERFRAYARFFYDEVEKLNATINAENLRRKTRFPRIEPSLFVGFINGVYKKVVVTKGYNLEMLVFNNPAQSSEWHRHVQFDRIFDYGMKTDLTDPRDYVAYVKSEGETIENGILSVNGTYKFEKWRKPKKDEACINQGIDAGKCLEGIATGNFNILPSVQEIPQKQQIVIMGSYEIEGRYKISERAKAEMLRRANTYKTDLNFVIGLLEAQGLLPK